MHWPRPLAITGILLAFAASAHADDETPRDPHVMKLSSDGAVGFLQTDVGIEGRVPPSATVHLSSEGLDPLRHAAILSELASAGASVVERDTLSGARSEVAADAESEIVARVHALGIVDVVVPPLLRRWSAPKTLVQLEIYEDADRATARQFLVEDSNANDLVCVGLRSVDGQRGVLRGQSIACGERDPGVVEALQAQLVEELVDAGACRGAATVLQLPTAVRGGTRSHLSTDTALYRGLNEGLATGGCVVLDIPPDSGDGSSWSYDSPRFDRIGASRVEGWESADYVLQIQTDSHGVDAHTLREELVEELSRDLLDPDLVRMRADEVVKVQDVELEVVQLATGRIVKTAHLELGEKLAGDVLAAAVVDLALDRRAQAWIEIHPIPDSGTVRVGRESTTGTGVLALRPGKHRADLVLVEGGKVEESESFELSAHTYGVLPVATPFGALSITTTPPGVEVLVDDVSWGPSPVTKTIGGGSHQVRAVREGCGEDRAEVEVLVGETTERVLHLPGVVVASVEPSEAAIAINGEPVGQGSASLRVPYGIGSVTFSLPGYDDAERSIAVESCADNPLQFSFEGKIAADSEPGGAQVRIDSADIGPGPIEEIVGIGDHVVSCHWCEWGNGSAAVEVFPGRTAPVSIPLEREGFRAGVGAYSGFLVTGDGPNALELGVLVEGWNDSRIGGVGTLALRPGAGAHLAAGPAFRLRGPAPQTSMVLSPQLHGLRGAGFGGGAQADLHVCVGRMAVFRVGLSGGYGPQSGALVGLSLGFNRRTGTPWKETSTD